MALLYVQGHPEGSLDSELASENVAQGDLIARLSGGGVEVADASSHDSVDGIAMNLEAGDNIADHEYDYLADRRDFVYKPSGNKDTDDLLPNTDDRVPIGGQKATAEPIPATIQDNGTDPAPSITKNDVVGVAAVGANEQGEIQGRVVQEGYTDNGGTTYGTGSAGDFIPVGYADEPVSSFDERVALRRAGKGL